LYFPVTEAAAAAVINENATIRLDAMTRLVPSCGRKKERIFQRNTQLETGFQNSIEVD
jgi:hypothetical protein